jgi:uncharacterized protein (DUF2461 family)
MPEPDQLKRIREALLRDAQPLRDVLNAPAFKKQFKHLQGDALKLPPKGVPADHPDLDLIKHKQFLAMRPFTDAQALAPGFERELIAVAQAMKPFALYFDSVLGVQ